MTFRDIAQGAWRMRGIGVGQTLSLLIPPEVADLIRKSALQSQVFNATENLFYRQREVHPRVDKDAQNVTVEESTHSSDASVTSTSPLADPAFIALSASTTEVASGKLSRALTAISSWLIIRGIQSESVQIRLLLEHNLFNVWRKHAFEQLCGSHSEVRCT